MPEPVGLLVLKLSGISGAFSLIYDGVAQVVEGCGRKEVGRDVECSKGLPPAEGGEDACGAAEAEEADGAEEEGCVCRCGGCRYDAGRGARYSAVHMLWNGPYHVPKLLFLNWLFPGAPTFQLAAKKTLVADLIFSPVEALGLLVFLQLLRDRHCGGVGPKLRNDFCAYQLVKWGGHVPAHFLAFYTSSSVVGIFVSGFVYKSVFEVAMAAIASRRAVASPAASAGDAAAAAPSAPVPAAEVDGDGGEDG